MTSVFMFTNPGASNMPGAAFSPDGKLQAASESDFGVVVRLATLGEW